MLLNYIKVLGGNIMFVFFDLVLEIYNFCVFFDVRFLWL